MESGKIKDSGKQKVVSRNKDKNKKTKIEAKDKK